MAQQTITLSDDIKYLWVQGSYNQDWCGTAVALLQLHQLRTTSVMTQLCPDWLKASLTKTQFSPQISSDLQICYLQRMSFLKGMQFSHWQLMVLYLWTL